MKSVFPITKDSRASDLYRHIDVFVWGTNSETIDDAIEAVATNKEFRKAIHEKFGYNVPQLRELFSNSMIRKTAEHYLAVANNERNERLNAAEQAFHKAQRELERDTCRNIDNATDEQRAEWDKILANVKV